jgi:hypothetical protein
MSALSQLKAAAWGTIGGVIGAAIVVFALDGWVTGKAADEVVRPSADAVALGQFGPTTDTLFSPPDYPTLLSPNPALADPPSAQSSPLATVTT